MRSVLDRRKNKDYRQVSGHIPAQQYKRFKSTCAFKECTGSEALEEAIEAWLLQNEATSHAEDEK